MRFDSFRESLDSAAKEASSAREALAEAKVGLSITGEALRQAQVRRLFGGAGIDAVDSSFTLSDRARPPVSNDAGFHTRYLGMKHGRFFTQLCRERW